MCEPSCWLPGQIRQLNTACRMYVRQVFELPGRLVNGCNAALNDQSGNFLVPNINISVRRAFQKALLSALQNTGNALSPLST